MQALRQKYPQTTIDVDRALACVRIHSPSAEQRQAVSDEIEAIVEQNFSIEMMMDEDTAIALKGAR